MCDSIKRLKCLLEERITHLQPTIENIVDNNLNSSRDRALKSYYCHLQHTYVDLTGKIYIPPELKRIN